MGSFPQRARAAGPAARAKQLTIHAFGPILGRLEGTHQRGAPAPVLSQAEVSQPGRRPRCGHGRRRRAPASGLSLRLLPDVAPDHREPRRPVTAPAIMNIWIRRLFLILSIGGGFAGFTVTSLQMFAGTHPLIFYVLSIVACL